MSVPELEQISYIVGLIYDAATDPSLWPGFAQELCRMIPSTDYNIHSTDVRTGRGLLTCSRTTPEDWQIYFEHYHHLNPYFHRDLAYMQTGRVFKSHETCSPEEFEKTEFYQGYFQRLNLFHTLGLTVLKDGDIAGNVSLARAKDSGIYTDEEANLLSLLTPHLQRAFRMGQILDGLRLERDLLCKTLDKIPQSAVIVSRKGHILFANRRVEQILIQNDGLKKDSQGMLKATSAGAHRQLSRLIENAGQPASDLSPHYGGLFQLERPSGLLPLSLLVIPLNPETSHYHYRQPSVLIFISDPEQHLEAGDVDLQQLLGLTPAEERLTMALLRGCNVVEAAEELNISQNTARTHLKRIFKKAGVQRQSDLIHRILTDAAIIK